MRKRARLLSTLMTTCLTMGLLAGCGSSAQTQEAQNTEINADAVAQADAVSADNTTESDAQDVTEIKYWYCWTGATQENNIELAEKFNETIGKEKGIHVTAEYQGTYDECHQKLQAAFVAGETPAVSVMEISTIRRFAESGMLETLDSYVNASGVDMSDFYEGLLPNCYVDDTIYGLPYLRSTPIMYCNNTILNEAGWDYQDIKTWDDLEAAARAVHEKTGKYGVSQYSYLWTLDAFMIEHGSGTLNDTEDATMLNTAEGKEVIGFWKKLIDDGVVHAYNHTEYEKVTTDVQNLGTAIWFGSTGSLKDNLAIAEELGFELGTAFIPKALEYGTPTGGCCVVMMSNISDEEKQAAWEFIKFMTETEQAINSSIKTGYLPSRKSAGESETMQKYFEEMPLAKVALDQLSFVKRAAYSNPNYIEAGAEIEKAMDAIYINDADIDSTLAELETKVNKILNQ